MLTRTKQLGFIPQIALTNLEIVVKSIANQLNKILRVAVYLRLSAEDGDKIESNSISNQRTLIHGYLQEHKEFSIVKEFIDDGYSGTNFDRPGFQEMMKFLKNGGADCVIVKDLSRLGRDFSGVLRYVKRIFPTNGNPLYRYY